MPINGLRAPINSSFPRARMISNKWVEPISGDVPPGWATLTPFEPWIAHEKKASWHRLFLLELGTSWVASMICHEYPWKVACCMHSKSTVLVRFLQSPAIVDTPSKVCWCLTTLATRSTRECSRLKMISRLLHGGEHWAPDGLQGTGPFCLNPVRFSGLPKCSEEIHSIVAVCAIVVPPLKCWSVGGKRYSEYSRRTMATFAGQFSVGRSCRPFSSEALVIQESPHHAEERKVWKSLWQIRSLLQAS